MADHITTAAAVLQANHINTKRIGNRLYVTGRAAPAPYLEFRAPALEAPACMTDNLALGLMPRHLQAEVLACLTEGTAP